MIYQNMKENGYSLEKQSEYMSRLINTKREQRDDLTDLATCMLILRSIYKNEHKIGELKEMKVEGMLGRLKQSQDVKVGQLVDDILIILHKLKE